MAQQRLHTFDVIRGFSVISMVGFHFCYDLVYLRGAELTWFAPPLQDIWRASISWTFLLVAGIMCTLSRDNLKRSGRYLAVAAAIFAVTTFAAVDTPISFGIIFCMGASTLVEALLERAGTAPRGYVAFAILVACFIVCLGLPAGNLGVGSASVQLPHGLYSFDALSWLGLPGPTFASGDYYPLLPFGLLYLAGAALGRALSDKGWPTWASSLACPPLEFAGRHALEIYVIHQPVLLLVAQLF